ncbi:MAG: tail fiber domain-containing protein, partial [Minisyncoccia bacterium]
VGSTDDVGIGGNITASALTGAALVIKQSGGKVGINNVSPGNLLSLNTPTTADSLADSLFATSATTQKGLVIQMKASQTADPFEIQDSTGATKVYIQSSGLINTTYNVISGGQVWAAGGFQANTWGIRVGVDRGDVQLGPTNGVSWGTQSYNTPDIGLSRISAGVLGVGNGTVGDVSGSLSLASITASGTITFSGLSNSSTGDYVCIDATTHVLVQGTAVCSLSSERFKTNVQDLSAPDSVNSVLDEVMALRPVTFNFKQGYGDNGATIQFGFIAEEAVKIDPRLVVFDKDGLPSGFNYPTYTAVITKAVQEMNINLEGIAGTVTPVAGSDNETFVSAFFNNIKTTIGTWLADAGNGIGSIFAKQVNTNTLCVSDDSGAQTCITKAQLDALLSGGGGSASVNLTPSPSPSVNTNGEGNGATASGG